MRLNSTIRMNSMRSISMNSIRMISMLSKVRRVPKTDADIPAKVPGVIESLREEIIDDFPLCPHPPSTFLTLLCNIRKGVGDINDSLAAGVTEEGKGMDGEESDEIRRGPVLIGGHCWQMDDYSHFSNQEEKKKKKKLEPFVRVTGVSFPEGVLVEEFYTRDVTFSSLPSPLSEAFVTEALGDNEGKRTHFLVLSSPSYDVNPTLACINRVFLQPSIFAVKVSSVTSYKRKRTGLIRLCHYNSNDDDEGAWDPYCAMVGLAVHGIDRAAFGALVSDYLGDQVHFEEWRCSDHLGFELFHPGRDPLLRYFQTKEAAARVRQQVREREMLSAGEDAKLKVEKEGEFEVVLWDVGERAIFPGSFYNLHAQDYAQRLAFRAAIDGDALICVIDKRSAASVGSLVGCVVVLDSLDNVTDTGSVLVGVEALTRVEVLETRLVPHAFGLHRAKVKVKKDEPFRFDVEILLFHRLRRELLAMLLEIASSADQQDVTFQGGKDGGEVADDVTTVVGSTSRLAYLAELFPALVLQKEEEEEGGGGGYEDDAGEEMSPEQFTFVVSEALFTLCAEERIPFVTAYELLAGACSVSRGQRLLECLGHQQLSRRSGELFLRNIVEQRKRRGAAGAAQTKGGEKEKRS